MKLTLAIAVSLLATSVHGVADHLWYRYSLPNITDWYNEIKVHPDMEPTSTYFMSNGFGNGYFGIQPNAPNKTVLFSIWDADDGTKVTNQYCGPKSICSTFGGEGTGLHVNYNFNWTAGVTYAGLIKTKSVVPGYTDFSGYFMHENKEWYHMATYRRKQPTPWLTGLYSFVENPSSVTINITRRTNFGNQWVRNATGHSEELTVAGLDHTSPLVASDRYGAGVDKTSFYLFINGPSNDIPKNTTLVRQATHQEPDWSMQGKTGGKTTKKSTKKTGHKTTKKSKKTTIKKSSKAGHESHRKSTIRSSHHSKVVKKSHKKHEEPAQHHSDKHHPGKHPQKKHEKPAKHH
ncbi:hypothetical protein INT43_009138 [Umbelopsis isabellina]|uniref:DUF5077 domain-containing protein n=1 Tax=Mortierella isabellina TaxID=91625 RepID=A0A8H7PCP1_MORIS|nr:hypothetical protein INT43_009138 [Umbelopsis isabellina]